APAGVSRLAEAAPLIAGAAFLDERLAGGWVAPVEEATDAGRLRLRRWRYRLGGAGPLARRLDELGTGEPRALLALSGARLVSVPDEPWARLLLAHLSGPDEAGAPDVPYGGLL